MMKAKTEIGRKINKMSQKKFKRKDETVGLAFDLKSSALSLHKARSKVNSKQFKSKGTIRKTYLPEHLRLKLKIGIVQKLHFKGSSRVLKYALCGSNQILVAMKPGDNLPLSGLYNLKLICGEINIFGYDIPVDKEFTIFSNELDGILEIKCIYGVQLNNKFEQALIENDIHPDIYMKFKTEFKNEAVSIVLLRRNQSTLSKIIKKTNFLKYYTAMQNDHPPSAARKFQLVVNVRPLLKNANEHVGILEVPKSWTVFANMLGKNLSDETCIVVCGGRNTGKSTLVRYICNRLLSNENTTSVACLDIDPIKPEFSVPGNLSLSVFSSPVLGPTSLNYGNMTFSLKQELVFTSAMPSDSLSEYYAIVKYLREASTQLNVPIIVNTMGYKKSLQVDIIIHLLRIICPSHVLQVHREDDLNSLDEKLNCQYVNMHPCLTGHKNLLNYKYKMVTAYGLTAKPFDISKEELRKYNLLSYMLTTPAKLRNSLTCMVISCANYAIHTMIRDLQPSYHLLSLNRKLVALCEVDEKYISTIENGYKYIMQDTLWNVGAKFHGFGYVVKTDTEKRELMLFTSYGKLLNKVNSIIAVGFPIPNGFRRTLFSDIFIPNKLMEGSSTFTMDKKPDSINHSSEEYHYVNRLICSDCLEDWKKGLQYLYVWKSRLSEVPIGVEITISLLNAKITLQDSSIDNMFKHVLIQGDICSFVNKLCKSYNVNMLEEEPTTASICALIEICPVIAEFRNVMTHMTTYIDMEISEQLVAKAMQWVKKNYWKEPTASTTGKRKIELPEEANDGNLSSKSKPTKKKKKTSIEKATNSAAHIPLGLNNSSDGKSSVEFKGATVLKMSIKLFFSMLGAKRPSVSNDVNYKFDSFMLNAMNDYISHPEEVMCLILEEMFLHPKRLYILDKCEKKCRCGCRIMSKAVSHMAPIFQAFTFVENNVSNHFLEAFLVKGNKLVFDQWFNLFVSNINKRNPCPIHASTELNMFANSIDWKNITIELMKTMGKLELRLAKRVISELGTKLEHCEALLDLLKLVVDGPDPHTEIDNTVYTVEMIQKSKISKIKKKNVIR